MIYLDVNINDAVKSNIITQDDADWVIALHIPYPGDQAIWGRKYSIDAALTAAVNSGLLAKVEPEEVVIQKSSNVISDDLGIKGVLNPADGKTYDSKSSYYQALKDKGCHVVGGEAGKGNRNNEGDHNVKKELHEAIQQHLR